MQSAPVDATSVKDKRTLVLFLLGLVLLFLDFWPNPKGMAAPQSYVVALGDTAQQWQVYSLPANTLDDANRKAAFGLADGSTILPLMPGQDLDKKVPASLSVFLNRPLPINRADASALEMLPGVGPHLAGAILRELQQQGRFSGPSDLLEVSGIGPKNSQRFLSLLSFD